MTPKVSVGWATIVGYVTGAGAILTAAGTAISGSEAQLAGPGKWAAILGVLAVVATNAGRQVQAQALIKAQAAPSVLPTEAEELAAQPSAADVAIPADALASVPAPDTAPPAAA
jgi:hypothetical protein